MALVEGTLPVTLPALRCTNGRLGGLLLTQSAVVLLTKLQQLTHGLDLNCKSSSITTSVPTGVLFLKNQFRASVLVYTVLQCLFV